MGDILYLPNKVPFDSGFESTNYYYLFKYVYLGEGL